MNLIFSPHLDKFVIIYFDDILVYIDNKHDHVLIERKVLETYVGTRYTLKH